jgi:hypothetical protein
VLLILGCALLVAVASVGVGYAAIAKTIITNTGLPVSGRLGDTFFASYWAGLSILLICATAAVCLGPVWHLRDGGGASDCSCEEVRP